MKTFLKILVLSIFFIVSFSGTNCGVDRIYVKSCADKEAQKIDTIKRYMTVRRMNTLTPPDKISKNMPRTGIEFNTYKVKAKIIYWEIEDDGDYHIVLQDLNDSTKTMVAEIPDVKCEIVKGSKFYDKIKDSRLYFESIKLSKNKVKPGIYILTGIGFFDKIHGQKGVAKNGIELHPVISVMKQ